MILTTYKVGLQTNPIQTVSDIIKTIAFIMGINKRSIYCIISEYKNTHKLKSHNKINKNQKNFYKVWTGLIVQYIKRCTTFS